MKDRFLSAIVTGLIFAGMFGVFVWTFFAKPRIAMRVLFPLLALAAPLSAANYQVFWNIPADSSITAFRIYSEVGGVRTLVLTQPKVIPALEGEASALIEAPPGAAITVTSWNGLESPPSVEVLAPFPAVLPPDPPPPLPPVGPPPPLPPTPPVGPPPPVDPVTPLPSRRQWVQIRVSQDLRTHKTVALIPLYIDEADAQFIDARIVEDISTILPP